MTILSWRKIGLLAAGILLTGQSCQINIGTVTNLDGGIYRSDNHGLSWVQKAFVGQVKKRTVAINDVSGRMLVFDPQNSDTLYLGTLQNGIWKTTNRGDQWTATSIKAGDYQCLAFDPLNSQLLYTDANNVVLKSVDGGKNWGVIYTEAEPGQVLNCVIVDPLAGRNIWAVTNAGKVIFSSDYGQTWTRISTAPTFLPRKIYMPSDGSGRIYIFTRNNGILFSADRGYSWQNISAALNKFSGGSDIRSVDISGQTWYLGTAFGILRSDNFGAAWTSINTLVNPNSIAIQNIAVNPRNQLDIFATTGQRLHHSTDGGKTWSISNLPTSRVPVLMTFDPANSNRLYLATFKVKK